MIDVDVDQTLKNLISKFPCLKSLYIHGFCKVTDDGEIVSAVITETTYRRLQGIYSELDLRIQMKVE